MSSALAAPAPAQSVIDKFHSAADASQRAGLLGASRVAGRIYGSAKRVVRAAGDPPGPRRR